MRARLATSILVAISAVLVSLGVLMLLTPGPGFLMLSLALPLLAVAAVLGLASSRQHHR